MAFSLDDFLARLMERLLTGRAATLAGRIDAAEAIAVSEAQSRLEDLAREFETQGKHEAAATLRRRASQLDQGALAATGVDAFRRLENGQLAGVVPRLPDFSAPPAPKGRRRTTNNDPPETGK